MLINNPSYGIKLADLLNLKTLNFNYEDLYKIVENWLNSEKKYFVVNDENLWIEFVESFCDRFYMRTLNFETTLELKIALRNCFRKYKNQAKRIYECELLELNPLITFETITNRTSEDSTNTDSTNSMETNSKNTSINSSINSSVDTSKSDSTSDSESTNDITDINKSESFNYDLHSDTPSNSVNIDDLFSVAKNYVTDAKNSKNKNNVENKSNSSNTNSSISTSNLKSTNESESKSDYNSVTDSAQNSNSAIKSKSNGVVDEISKGFNGNQVELIKGYMTLNTNVVAFYLDCIENDCLFSNILY